MAITNTTQPEAQRETHCDPAPKLLPLKSLLEEWDADAQARHTAKTTGKAFGPVTGLNQFDNAIGRALVPGVHVLHGVPGVGKTAFALQVAAMCGCPALYVSCEMTALELLRRITARSTETYLGKFKSGELKPDVSGELVRVAVTKTPLLALVDATRASISAAQIFEFAETTRNLDPDNPHLLILIDSLHSWAEGLAPGVPEYDSLNAGLATLRTMAAKLQCAVLAVAERNRASMKEGGLSAGAGSRKIEYGAETVIDLDTEKNASDDHQGEKIVKLHLAKNRHGAAGKTITLKFHGAMQRYREDQ